MTGMNTMSLTAKTLTPIAKEIKRQAEELLDRLETLPKTASYYGDTIEADGDTIEALRGALAMSKSTREQARERLRALESNLPAQEPEAFCMGEEAGYLVALIESFNRDMLRDTFPELIDLKRKLKIIYEAYWEATEWHGPSWWCA